MRGTLVPGTGLSAPAFSALAGASIAIFLFWGGALWSASAGAPHLARFVISYLAVLPLVVVALRVTRRLTTGHVLGATGSIWAVKLVVTAVLYMLLVSPGGEEAATPPTAPLAAEDAPGYLAAAAGFPAGRVRGRVVAAGDAALSSCAVWATAPAPGRSPAASAVVDVPLRRASAPSLVVAGTGDRLRLRNLDAGLHTAHVSGEGGELFANLPLPPGDVTESDAPDPGLYRIGCARHASEEAWLLVVDHPYVARCEPDGSFALDDVPAGSVALRACAIEARSLRCATARAAVPAGGEVDTVVRLEDDDDNRSFAIRK